MTLKVVMQELENCGTAQNQKVYRKHGAGDNLYGVSFKEQRKLAKKYKDDLDLAKALWKTENADARTLAILIAPPDKIEEATLTSWLGDISYYLLADLIADLISKSKHGAKMMKSLLKSKEEFELATGWSIFTCLLKNGHQFENKFLKQQLQQIEASIHQSPNRAKHAMNMAVIAIGIYENQMEDEVFLAANKIGKVKVDHGETSCKTPAIIPYIKKAKARRK